MKLLITVLVLCSAASIRLAVAAEYGTEGNPFVVGDTVQAWTNAQGVLTLEGTGRTFDYDNARDVPWAPSGITSVTVAAGILPGRNLFAAIKNTVTLNGTTLTRQKQIAAAAGVTAESYPAVYPSNSVRVVDNKAAVVVKTESEESLSSDGWDALAPLRVDFDSTSKTATIVLPAESDRRFYRLVTAPAPSAP